LDTSKLICNMRSTILLVFTFFLLYQPCISQTKAQITDVDFHLEDRYIVVNYNLVGALPNEEMTIELKFITEKDEVITPKSVNTDIGTKVFGDGNKVIQWDVVADQIDLSGNLKASVTITSSKILFKGPGNAFLSVLIPGLGGYFVDKNNARSVLTTLSTVGFIGYGVYEKLQSNKYYADYNESITAIEIEDYYTKASDANHKYFIATRVAAGIWALDIIYVTFKGFHNRKVAKNAYTSFRNDGLKLNYAYHGLQLGYSVTF
jgi:hypothetical protein